MKSIPSQLKTGIVLLVLTLSLAACGDKPQTSAPQPDPLFKPQRDALDKAKSVEQTEAQRAEDMKREEEKQTQ